ncbi:MAG TPA: excinuclease ABC subunit UvrC [Stellaceae bacterium]|nr:excinuclease ABC subunit UvrC [Stellaceae bacterium]
MGDRPVKQEVAEAGDGTSRLALGAAVVRRVLRTLPPSPGVYRMLNAAGDALYVGKARNLKNRVANYAHPAMLSTRLQRMVAETVSMEIVTTHTEVEALLLEINLIKRLMPRYNVLLRDDKSFPHIHLRSDHPVPQLTKHRGAQVEGGEYFGPFASAGAVNRTITALHRAFLLRSCSDSVFASRTRPCLQYQIKRCSAPCVGRISREDYLALVDEARAFLTGRSTEINRKLVAEMTEAADRLDYERAAQIRNRIRALAQIQADQHINVEGVADADVVALHQEGGHSCVQVFFFRGGQNFGNRAYFPSHDRQIESAEVMAAFLGQFYDSRPPPPLILLSEAPAEEALLAEALSEKAGKRVQLHAPQRGDKRKLVEHALANAKEALGRRLAESSSQRRLLAGVQAAFGLEAPPQRIEVYDNSHIQGTNAIGAMIVAGPEGFEKGAYRKFNIKGAAPVGTKKGLAEDAVDYRAGYQAGDDYAMMREVLERRFKRALEEDPDRAKGQWPDLVLIDGGAGQLAVAEDVFVELGIDDVALVAIAKGPDRDAGRERFFRPGETPVSFDSKDPVLYFLQRLRDEAHRFAIGTHRARRQKAIGASPLDEIAGIGPTRKRALLHHFGSARAVARAGLADLEQVPGISGTVAKKIYEHFHAGG